MDPGMSAPSTSTGGILPPVPGSTPDVTNVTIDTKATACYNGNMATSPPKTCGCGCGATVAKRYRPGHDAKHKSALAKGCSSPNSLTRDRAIASLRAFGWGAWVPSQAAWDGRERDSRGRAKVLLSQPPTDHQGNATWLVDHEGCSHGRADCLRLSQAARRAGQIHPITRLARPGYATPSSSTPRGWDLCEACIQDEEILVTLERAEVRRQRVLAALDLESAQRRGDPLPIYPPKTLPLPQETDLPAPTGPATDLPAPV